MPSDKNRKRYYTKAETFNACEDEPAIWYYCYLEAPDICDELHQYEVISIFKSGKCEHQKSWTGYSLESFYSRDQIEWENDDVGREKICSKQEFDTIKSLVLRLCKTNSMYFIPEAHDVAPWD